MEMSDKSEETSLTNTSKCPGTNPRRTEILMITLMEEWLRNRSEGVDSGGGGISAGSLQRPRHSLQLAAKKTLVERIPNLLERTTRQHSTADRLTAQKR